MTALWRVLADRHHRPLRVPVVDGAVACPLTRRPHDVGRCGHCPHLRGTLEGVDTFVLCAAPARSAPRSRPRSVHGSCSDLILFEDWPDEVE